VYIDYKEVKSGIYEAISENTDWWSCTGYAHYMMAMKGLTGIIFTVLGLAVLNYGTKLETAISS
jgi:hypothetical protein